MKKTLTITRLILSIAVVALAALQLLGILKNAIDYAIPLLGISLLLLSIQEWKENRRSAIVSICVALFIFVCSFMVWAGK